MLASVQQTRRWGCVAVLLAVAVALPAPAGATENGHDPVTTTGFSWTAPVDLTGAFAVGLSFEFDGAATCDLVAAVAGLLPGEEPVQIFRSYESGAREGWTAFMANHYAQVHVGEVVDTRTVTSGDGLRWATETALTSAFEGFLDVTVAGFNLEWWDQELTDAPFRVSLDCDRPFTVTGLWGGRDGRAFTRDSLEGGVGASATVLLPSATFSALDGLVHSFDAPEVRLRAGHAIVYGQAAGTMTLDHADGSMAWDLANEAAIEARTYRGDGPTGDYRLTVTRAAAGVADVFAGVLVGVAPVECLDEAVGAGCPLTE